jgi:hypothetical protein
MIVYLIGLTIIAVVGIPVGLYYAKLEREAKHGRSRQARLPLDNSARR